MSDGSRTGSGRVGLLVVGFFFLLIGVGVGYLLVVQPLLSAWDAQSWPGVRAEVVSSSVDERRDSDGTSYSPEVTYRYDAGGRSYTSDRVTIMNWSHSDRASAEAVVLAHPPGAAVVAYVDPTDPASAVLDRDIGWGWLVGIIPLVFALLGLVLIVAGLRIGRRDAPLSGDANPYMPGVQRRGMDAEPSGGGLFPTRDPHAPATSAADDASAGKAAGSAEFSSRGQRWGKFVGLTIFAILWNGIIWAIVLFAGVEWFILIFLSIFIFIGAAMVLGAVQAGMRLMSPGVRLTLTPARPRQGEPMVVAWEVTGSTSRLRDLRVVLEGVESATYTRGTDTVTDTHVFATRELDSREKSGTDPLDASGSVELETPGLSGEGVNLPPTFEASRNKILWRLSVKGDIRWWPDIEDAWDIEVLPALPETLSPLPAESTANPPEMTGAVRLETADHRRRYRPGDVVDGLVAWENQDAPKTVEVRLFWRTSGKGTQDIGVTDTFVIKDAAPVGAELFSLRLPASPPSYSGTLVSILWAIEAIVTEGKKRQSAMVELEVR